MFIAFTTGKVVEELFGSGLHTELIRRCSPVFVFLAERRKLLATHLDMVWAGARGKHEAVATVLYGLLAGIVRRLEAPLRTHLALLIRSLPFAEWNTHVMAIVRDFTVEATESDAYVSCAMQNFICSAQSGTRLRQSVDHADGDHSAVRWLLRCICCDVYVLGKQVGGWACWRPVRSSRHHHAITIACPHL